jgi:formylglycine-generating enzyme required for sulfatase activity
MQLTQRVYQGLARPSLGVCSIAVLLLAAAVSTGGASAESHAAEAPASMALIPAGKFAMGDNLDGEGAGLPVHTNFISAFYMDERAVSKGLWDKVYQWGTAHGYSFDHPGEAEQPNLPVHMVSWFDCMKWCNARSEMEGRVPAYYTDATRAAVYRTGTNAPQASFVKWDSGYRLPTEAEWEKAARGGLEGKRFPWGDTISLRQANYFADPQAYRYDLSPRKGHYPGMSPGGYFAPNGYGLYDMAGNVWQWCWDWQGPYAASPQSDPRGPDSGTRRALRGGSWDGGAASCRVSARSSNNPVGKSSRMGFRTVMGIASAPADAKPSAGKATAGQ